MHILCEHTVELLCGVGMCLCVLSVCAYTYFFLLTLAHSEGSELVVVVINKTKGTEELKRLQYSFDDNFDDFSRDDSPDLV